MKFISIIYYYLHKNVQNIPFILRRIENSEIPTRLELPSDVFKRTSRIR